MITETTMTARQQELCLNSAINHNGFIKPAAAEEGLRGGAYFMTISPLIEKGFVANNENNESLTTAGYAAIGLETPFTEQPQMAEPNIEQPTNFEEQTTAQKTTQKDQLALKKPRKIRTGTKQAKVIEMLKRPEGASLTDIMECTGWQMHTARSVLSRTIQKDLDFLLISEKKAGQKRIYKIK